MMAAKNQLWCQHTARHKISANINMKIFDFAKPSFLFAYIYGVTMCCVCLVIWWKGALESVKKLHGLLKLFLCALWRDLVMFWLFSAKQGQAMNWIMTDISHNRYIYKINWKILEWNFIFCKRPDLQKKIVLPSNPQKKFICYKIN